MTLALYGKSRRRQGGLLFLGVLAVLVAMLASVATYTSAFAHNSSLSAKVTCSDDTWSVDWTLTGDTTSKRLVIHSWSVTDGTTSAISPNPIPAGTNPQKATASTTGIPASVDEVTATAEVYWDNGSGGNRWPATGYATETRKAEWSDSCAKIVVKKVIESGNANTPFYVTLDNKSGGDEGSGSGLQFNPTKLERFVDFDSNDNDDDFDFTEAAVTGWNVTGWRVLQGNSEASCPSSNAQFGSHNNKWETDSNGQYTTDEFNVDEGETVTVCFRNAGPPDVNIQLHKYLPMDNENNPWQNQGAGQGDWKYTIYADNGGSPGAVLHSNIDHLNPSPVFPKQTVWLKETDTDGDTFYGWFVPDGDNNSGNDKCNQAPADFTTGNPDARYSTDEYLKIDSSFFDTTGNATGLFHICAYNQPLDPKVGLDKDDDGHGVYEIGDSFNFRLTFKVSNGPTTQDTVATDTIPSQFTIGNLAAAQTDAKVSCSAVGQAVTCTLDDGAADGNHVAYIPVTVAQGATCGPVTNHAEITENSPHRDPEDYTGDEEVTIPCPQTITLTLRVCKYIDGDSYDTSEPFTITVSDEENFEPNITAGGKDGIKCEDYQYTLPADEPTVDVTVNETEPSGWDQPQFTTKDQAGSESTPETMDDGGVFVTLGQGTCNAESQERQIQGNGVNTPQEVNPDCTVTIINNIPDPKVDVTFVKLMCGPAATIPSAFQNPTPVSYDPNNLPADCYPMAGWEFYTGTTWSNSTLGGVTATHTTGADGTVTHTMTQDEFDAATHAVAGNPYISYLVQEEERSPFTRGTLQCYKDYGGVNDNIEQVNFTDNAVSEDVTCIAYNRMPRVTVNFIKAICPSLGDVPSNQGANADRGGLLGTADPAANVKVGLDDIPEACETVPGWQFNTGTEWNGSLGGATDSHTTVANGVPGGYAGVQHTLTGAEFMAALKDFQTTDKSYFVQEVEQVGYLFGAIKCYADHYLDDKIERVDFEEWGLPTGDVYCIAYNVKAEREITITKHFVDLPDGFELSKDDRPAFVFDPQPAGFDFDTDCTPLGDNPVTWTCTVPYDWKGTVTETPADGWEKVTCEEPESFVSRVTGLVGSLSQFQTRGDSWEFCNRPVGTVVVVKYENVPPATAQSWNFDGTLPGAPIGLSTTGTTNVTDGDQATVSSVALGTYTLAELEGRGVCESGDTSDNYQTRGLVQVGGSLPSASDVNAAPIIGANDLNVTVEKGTTTYVVFGNQGCGSVLSAANLQVIKYSDPAGNFTGTTKLAGWDMTITGTAGAATGFNATETTDADGAFFLGIPDGTYTVCETPKANWVAIGSKYNAVTQAGVCRTGVVVNLDQTVVVNFYNQPRVNIEVNKTEISLATPAGAPGNGWSFTLTGCGITPQVKATDATGKATFSNLPPAVGCSYTVTETVIGGWSAINPVQVTAPATAGQTAVLHFTNIKIEVCTNCITIVTPTPTPETPTATPTDPSDPTATPTDPAATPTEEPTEDPGEEPTEDTAGEKTPGPGQTPIAPSTGTGFMGSGPGGVNMLFALVGLVAISLGTTILALGRKSSRR